MIVAYLLILSAINAGSNPASSAAIYFPGHGGKLPKLGLQGLPFGGHRNPSQSSSSYDEIARHMGGEETRQSMPTTTFESHRSHEIARLTDDKTKPTSTTTVSINSEADNTKKTTPSLVSMTDVNMCRGNEFCEDPDQYPEELAEKIIQKIAGTIESQLFFPPSIEPEEEVNGRTPTVFATDKIDEMFGGGTPQTSERRPPGTIAVRISSKPKFKIIPAVADGSLSTRFHSPDVLRQGQDFLPKAAPAPPPPPSSDVLLEETRVCSSIASYIYPKRGITKNSKYKFIVNSDPRNSSLVQAVLIRKCHKPDRPCDFGTDIELADYGIKTVCRQSYTYRKLLSMNETGQKEVDSFKFPTGCICWRIEEVPYSQYGNRNNPELIKYPEVERRSSPRSNEDSSSGSIWV